MTAPADRGGLAACVGTCVGLSLGSTLTVHEVVMRDDAGERSSAVRVANVLRNVSTERT